MIPTAPGSSIRAEVDGRVSIITIDRPPANALELPLVDALLDALAAAETDPDVGAVVITARGRLFVSGADIGLLRGLGPSEFARYVTRIQSAFDAVERIRKPVVAAVNGHAMGGGLELALACDVRFLADTANVGLPEVMLGLLPGAGGTQRLLRIVGKGRALDLLYTGRRLGADAALQLGLVEYVAKPDRLLPEAIAYAAQIASGPHAAHAAMKRAVLDGRDSGLRAGLEAEIEGSIELFGTEDAAEGIGAFLEKRAPRFPRR